MLYSANSAETASARLNALPWWDWTPVRTHFAGGGVSTCMFAQAFGCEEVEVDGRPWIVPRITDPAQVADLPAPGPEDGWPGQVLRHVTETAPTLPPGELIRCPDIQSPLGVAELLWDDSFYVALYEAPDAVHDLLDRITRYQIAYLGELQARLGDRLNPCGFPALWADGTGTMVADDSMSLVSPAMHAEFSVPYINRIVEAAGPLYYHSCTWREQYFDNLRSMPAPRSANFNMECSCDPAVIMEAFAGWTVLTPHLVIDMHKANDMMALDYEFRDEVDIVAYFLDRKPTACTLYFWLSNIVQKGDTLERIYQLFHERGHSPQARGLA